MSNEIIVAIIALAGYTIGYIAGYRVGMDAR